MFDFKFDSFSGDRMFLIADVNGFAAYSQLLNYISSADVFTITDFIENITSIFSFLSANTIKPDEWNNVYIRPVYYNHYGPPDYLPVVDQKNQSWSIRCARHSLVVLASDGQLVFDSYTYWAREGQDNSDYTDCRNRLLEAVKNYQGNSKSAYNVTDPEEMIF